MGNLTSGEDRAQCFLGGHCMYTAPNSYLPATTVGSLKVGPTSELCEDSGLPEGELIPPTSLAVGWRRTQVEELC